LPVGRWQGFINPEEGTLTMKKNILAMKLAAVGALSAVAGSAFALPAEVTDKMTEAGADAALLGGAVLLVIVGIASFKLLRRAA
jgi:hypothetical protein